MDLINQNTQSTGQLLFVDEPIAQRTIIIIAFAEPAVIHDQHFDAQFFGSLRKGNQFFGIEVEVGSFPVIDQQRPLLVFPTAPYQISIVEPMEDATHFTKTMVGINHDCLRCIEHCSRLQFPGEIRGVDTHDKPSSCIEIAFRHGCEIAGVDQIEAIA